MRTARQLLNLREALAITGNPIFLGSDELVDLWADAIQRQIDCIQLEWETKVRLDADKGLSWDKIYPEPNTVTASLAQIKDLVKKMFDKYPSLDAVMITEKTSRQDTYIFKRDNCCLSTSCFSQSSL